MHKFFLQKNPTKMITGTPVSKIPVGMACSHRLCTTMLSFVRKNAVRPRTPSFLAISPTCRYSAHSLLPVIIELTFLLVRNTTGAFTPLDDTLAHTHTCTLPAELFHFKLSNNPSTTRLHVDMHTGMRMLLESNRHL